MLLPDKINEYVTSVSQQIRWKKARARVSQEITNHIVDGRDSYMAQGLDEQTATDKAITDTGDSMDIGLQLDRIHRPKPQWTMFAWVAAFALMGLFISIVIFDNPHVTSSMVTQRIMITAVGVVIMMATYFADFTILGKYPREICLGVGSLMAIIHGMNPLTTHFVVLNMGFQLETFALVLPVVFAPIIYISRDKKYLGFLACLLTYGLLCVVTLISDQLSGFIHFMIIGTALMLIATAKNWFGINKLTGVVMVIIPHIIFFASMIFIFWNRSLPARMVGIIDPHSDPMGAGFATLQVRELLSNAVFLGEGVMPEFFPQAWLYSDYVLLTIIYRFGWLAFVMVMGALMLFIGTTTVRCMQQKSGLGFFVSIAVVLTLSAQIFMYVIFNMGVPTYTRYLCKSAYADYMLN